MQKYSAPVCFFLGSALTVSTSAAWAGGPDAVDLLRTVPTVVAVSSVVKGSSDKPDFLVDGDVETTWNSLSGDLHGWVAVRIPRSAQVTAIKLTAGYPKVKPKGDLFVMNHRIKKVRVLRDNVLVGEYPLNPEERGLQTLPVRVAGGDLRIEVVETVAGTKPSWRELCISELQVMGIPGPPAPPAPGPAVATTAPAPVIAATASGPAVAATATPPAVVRPVVRVGSLDTGTRKGALALSDLAGPYETPEAFAKTQNGTLYDPKLTMPKVPAASGAFLALRFIAVNDRCRLGIQTFRGWFFSGELGACAETTPAASAKAPPSPPDMGVKPPAPTELTMVSKLQLEPGAAGQSPVLLTELLLEDVYDQPIGLSRGSCSAALYVCGIGSSGRPSCTGALDLGGGSGLCGSIDGESEWSWRYRARWLETSELAVTLDEGASMGPTECEGSRRACQRAEKERSRAIYASIPDSVRTLAKAKPVVFP